MGDSNEIVESFKEWLKAWRGNNNVPPKSVLSGETLSKFIADLQSEIIDVIGDFGKEHYWRKCKIGIVFGNISRFLIRS